MKDMGTIKPGSSYPTDVEQTKMQDIPHKFISEAGKTSASSCSMRAYVKAIIAKRCWLCNLKKGDQIHNA